MSRSVAVLADPQFGIERILRPFKGFEDVYEDRNCSAPIVFCENNEPIDRMAKEGVEGYDPRLLSGLPVQIGARLLIDFPIIETSKETPYKWIIIWRHRNIKDGNVTRNPWHVPKESFAAVSTEPGWEGPRVLIRSSSQSVAYSDDDPGDPYDTSIGTPMRCQRLYVEHIITPIITEATWGYSVPGVEGGFGFTPDGDVGVIEQGVVNPAGLIGRFYKKRPSGIVYEMQACGDELILGLFRPSVDGKDGNLWRFGGWDQYLSLLLGRGSAAYPEYGVIVKQGVSP